MQHTHLVDKLGIALSALCAVHCALLPLAVLLFPMLAPATQAETPVHIAFALLLVFLTFMAFARGYRQHRRKDIVVLAALGLTLVTGALLAPGKHEETLFSVEAVLTTLGGFLLITGHVLNLRSMSCCGSCSKHSGKHLQSFVSGVESESAVAHNLVC